MIKKGLESKEASIKLKEFGFNELSTSRPKTLMHIALDVIKEPMFILLITCGVLYMILGDYKEGVILLSTILIIISITFFQHQKTEKALEELKKLSSPRALVIRDGIEKRIPGREVVPGDWVIVNEGDRIPADGMLIEFLNLQIDESIITGESLPVIKHLESNSNKLLSGTLTVKGRGIFIVEHTGNRTEFGKIGKSLEKIISEETPLQQEMKKLIRTLGIIGILISISVIASFYFTRGNFIQSLLNGLSAAMAILPEEFPVVLTVFLALGAWRLSKKNVLTRKPSAIETLGSATVLCCDKTGTITQNKMIVSKVSTVDAVFSKENIHQDSTAIAILTNAHLASQPESIDPMEKAIISSSNDLIKSITNYKFIKEYSFSHEFMAMTRVYEDLNKKDFFAYTKGAPEVIFKLCNLDSESLAKYNSKVLEIASSGLRVIAVASSKLNNSELPDKQESIVFTYTGLIGLEDPIRPEVPASIEECKNAGIRVILVTGDFPETAKNIAQQIGLPDTLLKGDQLDKLSDQELKDQIEMISIIARVKPEQKLRIVEALKSNNEIVAMTGDGVNDAPALKAAHIGIAMGNKGTDVAREASSLVLLDDDFASIVAAIRMGRKIFDNLQKAMSYILAIHIPIIGLTLLPAFFTSFPLLLMPLHIVFLELIIDPVSSIAFESEDEEKGIMERMPRNPNESFFGLKRILSSAIYGLALFVMVLLVYFFTHEEGHSEMEIRSITFTTLIFGNIFLVLTKLSQTRSFISIIYSKNLSAKLILLTAMSFLALIIFIPNLSNLFSLKFPGFKHIFIALIVSFIMLLTFESIKYLRSKKNI